MKRTILFFAIISCTLALVSAQDNQQGRGFGRQPRQGENKTERSAPPKAEAVSISGNLTIVKGMIAVKSNDVTYIAGGLLRYAGFIDGLKDGAEVKLEGNAFSLPQNDNIKMLRVQKMTLNGKDYDLARPRPNAKANQMHQRKQPPMYRQNQFNKRKHQHPMYQNRSFNNRNQPMLRQRGFIQQKLPFGK